MRCETRVLTTRKACSKPGCPSSCTTIPKHFTVSTRWQHPRWRGAPEKNITESFVMLCSLVDQAPQDTTPPRIMENLRWSMAGDLFHSLMLNAVDEIIRRDPEYLSKQPVRTGRAAPDGPSRTQKQFAGAQALIERCVEFLRRANIPLDDTAVEADDAWKLLMTSATDAEAAERGAVSLAPSVSPEKPIEHVLRDEYEERELKNGARYFVRRRGRQPLVLINASGVPAALWTQLLADETDHFRILMCESRASDLFAGGLHTDTTAEMDAADAALAVRQEGFDKVDVLAWCNGHLPAIELTEKTPVDSLVLLAPS